MGERINAHFKKPSTFRIGVVQLLTQSTSIAETTGIQMVTKMKGGLDACFKEIDKDNSGFIDDIEVKSLLKKLGIKTERGEQLACAELKRLAPRSAEGKISFEAFSRWYIASE